MTQVSPSILSADFAHLGRDIEMINRSSATMVHVDVMDGVFVPNISIGFPVIKAVRAATDKILDVHLMIVKPENYITRCRDFGADIMNVHVEASTHLHRTVQQIKDAGMKAAVTLNPATPIVMLEDIITDVDMVLLMSVNPGFGGQSFIPHTLDKLARLRDLIAISGSKAIVEIDGGVNDVTGRKLVDAGADVLVAGNYVFSAPDPIAAIDTLTNL